MPTVFIASTNRWAALFWKEHLQRHGVVVTSEWHNGEIPLLFVAPTLDQFENSDFVLIEGSKDCCGSFIGACYNFARRKKIIRVGSEYPDDFRFHNNKVIFLNDPLKVTRIVCCEDSQVPSTG